MKKYPALFVAGTTLFLLSACGGSKSEEKEEAKSTFGALKEFADKAEEMSQKQPVEPVNFQELKALLPENLAGVARTEVGGESTDGMGFKMSVAKAEYREEDKTLNVDIMDLGGVAGFGIAGLAAWTLANVERETSTGYERTIKLDGHKGFEKYDNELKDGELKVFINDRYLVSIEGNNVPMESIKSAFRQLDISKLPKE